ncbi:extracellular solute-binding protein [candidate division KSB1 bacterium]|nr:extracellular solute-binding protein [candidate division KSB1 bacterium]
MKFVFLGIFIGLILLSVVAWQIQPGQSDSGKIPLVWVSDDNPARREQIELFNRNFPEYHLKLDPGQRSMEKVIVQAIAGVGPDLFDCYDGYQLSAFVKSGIAWDVTDFFKEMGIDIDKDIWKAVHPNFIYEGRIYGFPMNAGVNAIWYNKAIFDACNEPYPEGCWTWEELIRLAKKLTVRDENGRIVYFGLLLDWFNWQQFVLQWGGSVYTADGTRCIIDNPEATTAIQLMQDLIYKHRVVPSPVDEAAMATQGGWGSGTSMLRYFGAGKGAMALGGRYWLCSLRSYQGLRLGAVDCPRGPHRVYFGYGRATLINRKSPRRREALNYFKYLASEDYNNLVNHQADALSPLIKYCYTPEFLQDPEYPNEDFNVVWRDVMFDGVQQQVSPFVSGHLASRILNKYMDLVRNNQRCASDAMRIAAQKINAEIQKNLQRNPQLHARFIELKTGKGE